MACELPLRGLAFLLYVLRVEAGVEGSWKDPWGHTVFQWRVVLDWPPGLHGGQGPC